MTAAQLRKVVRVAEQAGTTPRERYRAVRDTIDRLFAENEPTKIQHPVIKGLEITLPRVWPFSTKGEMKRVLGLK